MLVGNKFVGTNALKILWDGIRNEIPGRNNRKFAIREKRCVLLKINNSIFNSIHKLG